MHGDILVVLEGKIELGPMIHDVHPDVEVGCLNLVLGQEIVEAIGWLCETS
jgi:hypothetical protein